MASSPVRTCTITGRLSGKILHARSRDDPHRSELLDDALFATSDAVIASRTVYEETNGRDADGI
jgi:hypothetical protein